METHVVDAINIKSYPLSENDNIVVMFSKEMGLIRGIAKGVKRPKSKLGGNTQALVANKLVLNRGRNLNIIKEASALNPFNKLRYDLDKLTTAFYAAEIVNTFCVENGDKEQNKIIFDLLYKTFENIQNANTKAKITLSAIKFQLAFMREQGFGVELERCLKCSRDNFEESVYFSPLTGGIMCNHCVVADEQYVKLHSKIRDFLIEISKKPIDKKTKYDDLVNEKVANGCFNLLKKYIEITSSKKSKAFRVMESIKVS